MKNGEYSKIDDTHQNRFGSFLYAGYIAEEIKEIHAELSKFLLDKPRKYVAVPDGIKDRIEKICYCFY